MRPFPFPPDFRKSLGTIRDNFSANLQDQPATNGLAKATARCEAAPSFMKLLSQRWAALVVTLLLGATSLRAADEEKSGILFLRLQVNDGVFSLASATNVPGKLKAPRRDAPAKEFQMVVEDAAGKAVWTEEIADPSVERLEYTEAAQPGVIQVKEVRRAQVEFTIRVPAASAGSQLAIYRRVAPPASAAQKTTSTRELVTRLALP